MQLLNEQSARDMQQLFARMQTGVFSNIAPTAPPMFPMLQDLSNRLEILHASAGWKALTLAAILNEPFRLRIAQEATDFLINAGLLVRPTPPEPPPTEPPPSNTTPEETLGPGETGIDTGELPPEQP